MIEAFERKLGRNRNELERQRLFEINPFILSMIFGYPLVVVQPSASVGGGTVAGTGTKIADFLSKNSSTHNAALVEIKRPNTTLFGAEYRAAAWAPSPALTGAVVQVLDQRQNFVSNIAPIKHWSKIPELEAYSVDWVLVAGRTPTVTDQIASFELIRSQTCVLSPSTIFSENWCCCAKCSLANDMSRQLTLPITITMTTTMASFLTTKTLTNGHVYPLRSRCELDHQVSFSAVATALL